MKFGGNWREHADRGDYHTAIVEYVRELEPATFHEVVNCLADQIDIRGGHGLRLAIDANIIVWAGMSRAVSDLIIGLIRDGRLHLHRCDLTPYRLSESGLKLPVIDAGPNEPLDRPHWLPCLLSTEPDHDAGLEVEFDPEWN